MFLLKALRRTKSIKVSSVVIPDNIDYPKDCFCINPTYQPYIDKVIVPEGLIKDRIQKMAFDIASDYGKKPFTMVCVMKGAFKFFTDLVNSITSYQSQQGGSFQCEFIKVSSYKGTQSTGKINIQGLDVNKIKGQDLIIVEDLIDTGKTLKALNEYLIQNGVKSVKFVTLMIKRNPEQIQAIKADYLGFVVPNYFIIGYGTDYNENFRDLNHLCCINQKGINSFKQD